MPLLPENVVALGRIGGPLLDSNLKRKNAGTGEENLAFGNTSLVNPTVLYLDVINGRVGINTDTPTHPLNVSNIRTTNLIVPTQTEIENFVITTNTIQNISTAITISPDQTTDPVIDMVKIGTYDYGSSVAYLNISDQLIENINNNSNIEISPNGLGAVNITTSKLYVDGNFTATGNINWDGSLITLGSNDSDNVVFNADVNSNIVPNINETYDLGTALKRWNTIYTEDFPVDNLNLDSAIINGIDMLLEQGNTIYVSIYGDDLNVGTHLHNTYRTVKYALSQATAGDTVVIFPGTYEEIFPLTVPAGVTVNGAGIRAVTIIPTVGTNTNNAFLLNGETTVSNLTVKDFYTGYAFSFASGFTVTSRSPYVQNVTVITTGPNAGNGALVDGSLANSSSKEASMLFHSITMIVPNSIGITATNGARVEWLNSFTYFAEKGIYLTQGALGFASLGVKYGAEIRSIGSANVYGTYGAVADGANTLAYLISHNFAYIGAGTTTSNEPHLVIQANEVVELNSGKIYYESVDAKGDFRIGDIFYVNQETGAVVFNAQSISFLPTGNITLTGPTSSAFIDATTVDVGNIRVYDNTIESVIGPINFSTFSGTTNLSTNIFVTGNTEISADAIVRGNLYLGNQASDTITIYPEFTQDLLPDDVGGPFTLGTDPKRWDTLYSSLLNVDDIIQIDSNTIETLTTDTDLILQAAGIGKINVVDTNVTVNNNLTTDSLTVNGLSTLQDLTITGTTLQTGNWGQTGNLDLTGDVTVNILKITGLTSYFTVPDFKFEGNEISITALDQDLNIFGNTTGAVILKDSVKISGSTIESVSSSLLNQNLTFTPDGTGNFIVDTTKSLKIPIGNNTTRTLNAGEIRYNNVTNLFEGGGATGGLISFNGLYDSDRNTYITTGGLDNTIYFGINNSVRATIDSTSLESSRFDIGNIRFEGNTVLNSLSGNDLILLPTGTGNTLLNNIGFSSESTITNQSNSPLVIKGTGSGYISFASAAAVMLPMGLSAERPLATETGLVRYNTTFPRLEVYTGDPGQGENGWVTALGEATGIVDANVIEGLLDFWTLILG
jgi:hypothetical protein